MMFLRDEMVPAEMAGFRYGFDTDWPDWYYNLGYTADDISIQLFGA